MPKKTQLKSTIVKHARLNFESRLLSVDLEGRKPSRRYQVVLGITEEQANELREKYNANVKVRQDPNDPDKTYYQITARTNERNIGNVKIVSADPKVPFDLEGSELPRGTLVSVKIFFPENSSDPDGPNQNILQKIQVIQMPQFNDGNDFDVEEDYVVEGDDFNEDDFPDEDV